MSDWDAISLLYEYIEMLEAMVTREQLLEVADDHPEFAPLLPELELH